MSGPEQEEYLVRVVTEVHLGVRVMAVNADHAEQQVKDAAARGAISITQQAVNPGTQLRVLGASRIREHVIPDQDLPTEYEP